ncbi:MAG: fructosamine kinase family protein [Alphaproteobacteria bacterium]|nr:fructosamine kinase family protein [Alphaproteobacteria bacterium]
MITTELQAEIEQYLKGKIASLAPLSAANNAHIYRVTVKDRTPCVVKVAERGLDVEAYMLNYLKTKSKLPVPVVYYSNEHIIIMEFIESHHGLDEAAGLHAAELLAELHKIHADSYGLEQDTLIGFLRQPNTPTRDWVSFFAQHRLLYMAGEALKENKIEKSLMKQVEKLAGKLSNYIKKPNPPSLIHGDIWGGNILSAHGKIVAFLDPAIYYADPEMELAFIRLFNTFSGGFFARYNDLNPIKPGFFEERADIYSLYPLLVHARLFGASYARKAQKILDKFT